MDFLDIEQRTFFRLRGPGADRPKAPAVDGWQSPAFKSLDRPGQGTWLALRVENIVVVDCDNQDAFNRWVQRVGLDNASTFMRKSPHGYHLFYAWTQGSPETQRLGVFDKTDIKAGYGSYVVWEAPGYHDITDVRQLLPFNPQWLPAQTLSRGDEEEWEEIPEGRGNDTMFSFASTMRRQGASRERIIEMLDAINEVVMPTDPMPPEMLEQIANSACRYVPEPDWGVAFSQDDVAPESDDDVDQRDYLYMDARKLRIAPHQGWWWEPYLPKASLVVLEAEEGVGKTMFAAWAATSIALGRPMDHLDDDGEGRPVVWYSMEDDIEGAVLPRLHAAGYDDDAVEPIWFFNDDRVENELRFPRDTRNLEKVIATLKPALVVFDPGRDHLAPEDGAESSNNNERALRPGLRHLNRIAQRTGTTILFLHHQNKRGGDSTTRERSTGSVAFRQVARQVLTMMKVEGHRAMSVEKANGIDHEYTVRSFDIEPVGDTAVFRPGGHLHEYRDLDDWRRQIEALEAEAEKHIDFGIEWADVVSYYDLETGALAPTVDNIQKDLGVDEERAKAIRHQLREHGYISQSQRWVRPS